VHSKKKEGGKDYKGKMGDQNPFMTGGLFLDVLISNYWKIRFFYKNVLPLL